MMQCGFLTTEPILFFYTIVFTVNNVVLPQLLLYKTCISRNIDNSSMCQNNGLKSFPALEDEIQRSASKWWFAMLTLSLGGSLFTILIWGPVTDIVGRKKAIKFVPICSALQATVYLVNTYFIDAHPAYLLLGAFLSCLYGEFQGVAAVCYSYMADATSGNLSDRTMRMAILEGSLFLAGVPSGFAAGLILDNLGYLATFVFNIAVCVLIYIYASCCLPDVEVNIDSKTYGSITQLSEPVVTSDQCSPSSTHIITERTSSGQGVISNHQDDHHHDDDHHRIDDILQQNTAADSRECIIVSESQVTNDSLSTPKDLDVSMFNPIIHYRQMVKVTTDPRHRHIVQPLLLAFSFSICAVVGELMVSILYMTNRPFNMASTTLGYYMASQALVRGLGVIVITQVTHRCCHMSDWTLIKMGLVSQIVNYLLLGLSRTTLQIFLCNISGFAVPVVTASLRSLITKQVSPDCYGATLAAIESIDAMAGLITNGLSLWSYNLTLTIYSGVVFFGLSVFALISLLIVLVIHCKQARSSSSSSLSKTT